MAEPNILCVAIPFKSNQINAYDVQILHEFGQTYPVTEGDLQSSLPSNSSSDRPTPSELVIGGFQSSNGIIYEATSNGRPVSSFSENMLNMSYVCSILCKLLMIGSIMMIIIIIILSAHNKG